MKEIKYFETFEEKKKKKLTRSIPSCTVVRFLYILQIQLNTIIHYRGQPLHIIVLRNKIFTKITIVFPYLRVTKMTLEEQAKYTPMLQCLTGSAEHLKAHFSGV